MEAGENIVIRGAKVNNLKNISITIPRNKFTVITGVSGSGKSSLAFDTLFAEGQRRFAESLSSYARQFLGRMSKPDVEAIEGIPPAIAIEQKVNVRNPRSTVATVTEIYDYLRIIFARIGRTFSPVSGVEVKCHGSNDVMAFLTSVTGPFAVFLLADLGWDSRTDKVELLLALKEKGYSRLYSGTSGTLRIDDILANSGGESFPEGLMLMVDRVKIDGELDADLRTRLLSSISTCFSEGNGKMYVVRTSTRDNQVEIREFNNRFEADGMTFREPDEYMFSFNSPLGACPVCGGLGKVIGISEDLVVPDKALSIYDGAIACWKGEKMGWFKDHLISVAGKYGIPIFEPYCNLPDEVKSMIWEGRKAETEEESLIGLNEFFKWVESNKYKIQYKYLLSRFSGRTVCGECKGSRLRKDALYVKVGGKNIHELLKMTAGELLDFFKTLELADYEKS
ncbi:MAG: excinuclease ABC subunit A, partial [Candidatus Cryptobacteroides sp.]